MSKHRVIDGKYALRGELGRGSIGRVYEVEHVHVGKRLALKLLHDDLAEDSAMCTRFLASARSASGIKHANVAAIEDIGITIDNVPYLVMERCAGRSLLGLMSSRKIPLEIACEITLQILAAIAAAHQLRILHRDLKPQNVIVGFDQNEQAHVKVADFAITQGMFDDDARHDQARWVTECPRYIAPEQALSRNVDVSTDVYGAAAILYEMLAGQPLINETDDLDAMKAIVAGAWVPIAQLNPGLPEPLVRALEAALATDPNERLATPHAFARQLSAYVRPETAPHTLAARSIDPVLRFSRRLFDKASEATPSLLLNRAPRPRQDSACPEDMLLEPRFPKSPPAPRLESLHADAYGKGKR